MSSHALLNRTVGELAENISDVRAYTSRTARLAPVRMTTVFAVLLVVRTTA